MRNSENFKIVLEEALSNLQKDEWAVSNARDNFVNDLEPHEAFSEIMGIINLAKEQTDSYAFDSCCWLILQLAGKAKTTESPEGLEKELINLLETSKQFGDTSVKEVHKVATLFRHTISI